MGLGVAINRNPKAASCFFSEIFKGFESVEIVRAMFGKRTEKVLSSVKVVFSPRRGYLHVDDKTGSIVISSPYIKSADERHIYLDLIHELTHVKQMMDGMELFDESYSYVDRPTEIEAYKNTVEEARRIGMSEEEIIDYLWVDWISDEDFERLLKNVNLKHD
ncbi:MAG: hypothetical protein JTT11_09730 [Candidatus Brockarchaeota archaeon]|nr:hypothetical protein [Candidatus Brockarchaeota archaeon]